MSKKVNYAFNIEINNMFIPITELTLATANAFYPQHNIVDDSDYKLKYKVSLKPIYVDIADHYNIYTYDSTNYGVRTHDEYTNSYQQAISYKQITNMLMNLIAHGHDIILCTNGKEYPVGTPSLRFIHNSILQQAEYLLITRGFKRINDVFLSKYILDSFGSYLNAIAYLQTSEYIEECSMHNRFITVNNLIRDTLMDIQQDVISAQLLLNQSFRKFQLTQLSATLNMQGHIPNQDTTPASTDFINIQLKFEAQQLGKVKEYGASYVTPSTKTYVSDIDKLEQQVVNAYYYNTPEFRVPSEDEEYAEYQTLVAEYEDLKHMAHSNPTKARLMAKQWVSSHVRLMQLEEKFNTVIFGELKHIESLTKKPKSSRYDG